MEGNGVFSFDFEGKKYTLHFGMMALEIFSEGIVNIEETNTTTIFTNIVHSGLVNENYLNREPLTQFRDSAILVENILLSGSNIQNDIMKCWEESRASKKLVESLDKLINGGQKKSVVESVKESIGKALRSKRSATSS